MFKIFLVITFPSLQYLFIFALKFMYFISIKLLNKRFTISALKNFLTSMTTLFFFSSKNKNENPE